MKINFWKILSQCISIFNHRLNVDWWLMFSLFFKKLLILHYIFSCFGPMQVFLKIEKPSKNSIYLNSQQNLRLNCSWNQCSEINWKNFNVIFWYTLLIFQVGNWRDLRFFFKEQHLNGSLSFPAFKAVSKQISYEHLKKKTNLQY